MKVLVVGGGGREHALAWKCAQSARVERVFVAPGNAGTAREPNVCNVEIGAGDFDALIEFAAREDIELTIVGPEAPLVAGIVDRFAAAGRRASAPPAPRRASKGRRRTPRNSCKRHGIPTAGYATFTASSFDPAFVRAQRLPVGREGRRPRRREGRRDLRTHETAIEAASGMLVGALRRRRATPSWSRNSCRARK